ncbi:MAG: T9SS type A sorting domain-containing protein [Bernardetiaceae bacterium]
MFKKLSLKALLLLGMLLSYAGVQAQYTVGTPSSATATILNDDNAPTFAVRYVKADATGANNGSSFADAYTSLQAAFDAAAPGDVIVVAAGTYKPTKRFDIGSDGSEPQDVTFNLVSGVETYGGFAGTETFADGNAVRAALKDRNLMTNATTLSGDIAGNDQAVLASTNASGVVTLSFNAGNGTDALGTRSADNAWHVVVANGVTTSCVLDGFVVTGGYAYGNNGSPAVHELQGGGILVFNTGATAETSPTLRNLVVAGNYAASDGGGIYVAAGTGKTASPVLENIRLYNNKARNGAGMFVDARGGTSQVTLRHGLVYQNSAFRFFASNENGRGGAICADASGNGSANINLYSTTISRNYAEVIGGGFYGREFADEATKANRGTLTFTMWSSILWNNNSPLANEVSTDGGLFTSQNTIARGLPVAGSGSYYATADFRSNVSIAPFTLGNGTQVTTAASLTLDPMFVDPANANFELQAMSPAIDRANPGHVLANSNGEFRDLKNDPRFVNTITYPWSTLSTFGDLGAFERQAAAVTRLGDTEELVEAEDTFIGADALTFFPNPTTGDITIRLDERFVAKTVNVSIFNVQGQRMESLDTETTNSVKLDLGTLPAGLYFVQLSAGSDMARIKVVKR